MFIKPCNGRITSHFNLKRLHPITKRISPHYGIDFGSHSDNNIYAAADGKVTRVDYLRESYGNFIYISHKINGRTYQTAYAHLKSTNVKVGQTVKQGQIIGVKGTTGSSTGVHLHFEIHDGGRVGWKNAVNPVGYINDPSIALTLGVTGPRVGDLQRALNQSGYKLTVDNSFGPATDKAVKDLQRKNNLTVDGSAGPATFGALSKVKTVSNSKSTAPKGKTLHLPKTASSWRVYPTDKAPVKANALKTRLNPKKFGGLSYEILASPQKDVYTIQTQQLGKVNIYATAKDGAVIK